MDIPESGAVFTIGKSALSSDDHQSYFFIKNDAVNKLIAGIHQSAVICESGRLFVWGKNQFGQLGISSSTTITRPTCVKEFKHLSLKVKDIAFGESFSIVVSTENRIYFCGKRIGAEEFDAKPFEISEFQSIFQQQRENEMQITQIRAGALHFVLLTENGETFGWGSNEHAQISKDISEHLILEKPHKYNWHDKVVQIRCGQHSTIFLTASNKFFIQGERCMEVQSPDTNIIDFHMTYVTHELYIITELGVYKDFEKIELDDLRNDGIIAVTSGTEFLSYITDHGKFFTTYDHDHFAELKKFANMRIVAMSSGLDHVIIHAVPQPMETIDEESVVPTQPIRVESPVDGLLSTNDLINELLVEDSDSSHHGSECTVKYHPMDEHEDENLKQIDRVVDLVRITEMAGKLNPKGSEETIQFIDISKGDTYNVSTKDGELQKVELLTSSSEEDHNVMVGDAPNEIRFINNGIDVTNDVKKLEDTFHVRKKSEKSSILRSSKVAPSENVGFVLEDRFLGEKLTVFQMKEIRDSKLETQQHLRDAFEKPAVLEEKRKIQTPMPKKSQRFLEGHSDDDDDDSENDDRMTTASIVSEKYIDNPFENEDKKKMRVPDGHKTILSVPIRTENQNLDEDKTFKQLYRELKESSCTKLTAVANCECLPQKYKHCMSTSDEALRERFGNNKTNGNQQQQTSQVCNIL